MSLKISLHKLAASVGKKARRVGRGNAKGGNTSGRGNKGQKARSGGKRGIGKRSIKGYMLKIPKSKGFVSQTPKYEVIKISTLEKYFKDGEIVNLRALKKLGLIKGSGRGVKVLGDSKLTKKLTVKLHTYAAAARNAIVGAGGSVEQAFVARVKEAKKTK